jgi:hypothetical protein
MTKSEMRGEGTVQLSSYTYCQLGLDPSSNTFFLVDVHPLEHDDGQCRLVSLTSLGVLENLLRPQSPTT